MENKETGKLREFNMLTPVKVKFTRGELIDWTNVHFGMKVESEKYQAYLNKLIARCDENGYMPMQLQELIYCMHRNIKDYSTVGGILVDESNLRKVEQTNETQKQSGIEREM